MKKRPYSIDPAPAHFVTTRTNKRVPLFRSKQCCHAFFEAVAEIKHRFPFELHAYVLMPDHFRLLARSGDGDISRLMQKIKSISARKIISVLKSQRLEKRLEALRKTTPGRKGHTFQVWQQSFRTLGIVTPKFFRQKIKYIHENPLRAGLAKNAAEYPWSSWRSFEQQTGGPVPVDPICW